MCTDICRGEQEAAVLVIDEDQSCAIQVREYSPHTNWVAVAAYSLPVLHKDTYHIT